MLIYNIITLFPDNHIDRLTALFLLKNFDLQILNIFMLFLRTIFDIDSLVVRLMQIQ